ncbi:MAG: hypothetical protein LiPW39_68 [Parcubacteria group bacterium LiPW_39]|nr:MAG: hypothetical protein LiPW39_68 [Parcubacteria group bacterium LiPW_39]
MTFRFLLEIGNWEFGIKAMKFYLKTFSILLAISYLLLAIYPVQAALVPCSGLNCTVCDLFALLGNITNFILKNVMPPLAGLLFLVGGIMMVAAAGSEERFKKGRTILVNTLIGVVIVLAAWVVINTLITTLGKSLKVGNVSYNPADWWRGMSCGAPSAPSQQPPAQTPAQPPPPASFPCTGMGAIPNVSSAQCDSQCPQGVYNYNAADKCCICYTGF